jgi:thiamine pyrophosphate-dependent acetolactate synthase large subunit-like protein
MLMCEFLTAVHHKLPVKVVVYNNSAFGLIPLEAEAVGLPAYREAIEFPNPDFSALARACGGRVCRATRPGELAEFGTELPDSGTLRTHDSNADMRYLVLPERPAGTDGWSQEQLADIVTRDCMVGVAFPKAG